MAQVDVIKVDSQDMYLMNVTAGVGPNWGMPDDVRLVKALLIHSFIFWGLPTDNLSNPTAGTLDKNTQENIRTYQKYFNEWAKSSVNPTRLTSDGRVSRARGQTSWDKNRPWTIVTMNVVVGLSARLNGLKSAAELVIESNPELAEILKIDPSTL